MPFSRPTLPDLIQRVSADFDLGLTGADARLRRSVERAIAVALAGLTHELHGYLQWLSKQLFAATSEKEFLLLWGSLYKMTLKPPKKAAGDVDIAGVNGSPCEAGTLWQRGNGTIYVQDADATIVGGVATISVTAQVAGAAGNADEGVQLTLVDPRVGIASEAVVAEGGISNGFDEETVEEFRARVIERMSNPPKGGGPGDYITWALALSGVTKAWELPRWQGIGTVGVSFVLGSDPLTMIPDNDKVADMQNWLMSLRQVTAGSLFTFAPVALPVNYSGLAVTPNTAAVRNAVAAELQVLHRFAAELGESLLLWRIRSAIGAAPGLTNYTLASPSADVVAASNQLPLLGTVGFV